MGFGSGTKMLLIRGNTTAAHSPEQDFGSLQHRAHAVSMARCTSLSSTLAMDRLHLASSHEHHHADRHPTAGKGSSLTAQLIAFSPFHVNLQEALERFNGFSALWFLI